MDREHEKFEFEVEGTDYHTDDRKLSGRDVRLISEHDPAADYRLILVNDRYTSSIGLEDRIELKKGEKPVFRIFEGDRDFDFTVDDLGWEWGAGSIPEADIRKYGRIPEDRELVIKGPVECVIPRGGLVDLTEKGVERIYSRKIKAPDRMQVTFIINGEPHPVKVKPSDRLVDALEMALKETENTGQPVDAWQVTDEPGNVLDVGKTFMELDICDGAILVASLKAGAAG